MTYSSDELSKDIQMVICETQGDIFQCANELGYDMDKFVPAYMKSHFCERSMDTAYSPFQMADPEECLDFILPEINVPKLPEPLYIPDALWWIGFIYRLLYFELKKSSNEIIDKVPFKAMLIYYPGLSTVDEYMAVEIISEDKFLR
ncbi:hypothetical protein [Anaerovibrio sp. RM50]|uniref:hypothetical protein n=1 Tax=Anaerovibrio sp. RM50 TaxID=1200557 RepID=UPI000487B4DE|nr:hypothetical protein [Anaerovibrio sp. RM50]